MGSIGAARSGVQPDWRVEILKEAKFYALLLILLVRSAPPDRVRFPRPLPGLVRLLWRRKGTRFLVSSACHLAGLDCLIPPTRLSELDETRVLALDAACSNAQLPERARKRVLPKTGDEPSNLEALALAVQLLQRGVLLSYV